MPIGLGLVTSGNLRTVYVIDLSTANPRTVALSLLRNTCLSLTMQTAYAVVLGPFWATAITPVSRSPSAALLYGTRWSCPTEYVHDGAAGRTHA